MKNIYKGNLKKLTVSKLQINGDTAKILEYQKTTVKKDLLFYEGMMGTLISFDYGTRLLDEEEAIDIVKDSLNKRDNYDNEPKPSCIFINEDDVVLYDTVTRKQFKQMKKQYKIMRQMKRKQN